MSPATVSTPAHSKGVAMRTLVAVQSTSASSAISTMCSTGPSRPELSMMVITSPLYTCARRSTSVAMTSEPVVSVALTNVLRSSPPPLEQRTLTNVVDDSVRPGTWMEKPSHDSNTSTKSPNSTSPLRMRPSCSCTCARYMRSATATPPVSSGGEKKKVTAPPVVESWMMSRTVPGSVRSDEVAASSGNDVSPTPRLLTART
mmetsp:Transcript_15932/g.55488  ORF Transcript_15932/g.55488 Transcript_15932/m.55488 type:complete len:202 (-) Transcript_15932:6907-7512(-)